MEKDLEMHEVAEATEEEEDAASAEVAGHSAAMRALSVATSAASRARRSTESRHRPSPPSTAPARRFRSAAARASADPVGTWHVPHTDVHRTDQACHARASGARSFAFSTCDSIYCAAARAVHSRSRDGTCQVPS